MKVAVDVYICLVRIEPVLPSFIKPACMPKQFKKGVLDAVRGVKRTIDNNPLNGVSTAILAERANVSRNALQEAFKEKYGTSIGQYKLELRMTLATQQLKNGKSIKEVTIMLKYSSPSSFSNAFRNFHELSPTDWIKKDKATNGNKQVKR
jgi:AraC-like DNA-binding protein